jgi:hypothetical protein
MRSYGCLEVEGCTACGDAWKPERACSTFSLFCDISKILPLIGSNRELNNKGGQALQDVDSFWFGGFVQGNINRALPTSGGGVGGFTVGLRKAGCDHKRNHASSAIHGDSVRCACILEQRACISLRRRKSLNSVGE